MLYNGGLFQESTSEMDSDIVLDLSDINHLEEDGSQSEGNSIFIRSHLYLVLLKIMVLKVKR